MFRVLLLVCGVSSACGLLDPIPNTNYYPPGIILEDKSEYDYVVVGAGAGGAAAAARLALAGSDVLLLEAGGNPSILSKYPGTSMTLMGSSIDWQYPTQSNNKSCLGMRDRQCRFSRGKCLGGSTTMNYMQYTRGNRADYDAIHVPGWSWNDVKPYFLRYEGLQVLKQFPDSSYPYHNTTGIMKIEYFADPQNAWQNRLVDGMMALNYPYNIDVNGITQIGVSKIVGYVYKGKRMSTARGYLTRKDVKSKLKVAKYAHCTGVIIDNDNKARGVTVVQYNASFTIYARKEVVLSAGSIGNVQILQLSGIGPADHLIDMGIPVRVNLSVGDDLSDHVLPLMFVLVDKNKNIKENQTKTSDEDAFIDPYLISHIAPLTSNGITDITSFANMDCYDAEARQLRNNRSSCGLPDMQLISAYVDRKLLSLGNSVFQKAINLNDDIIKQITDVNKDYALIVFSPVILQPYSRGNIRLASKDPLQPPAIFPNYLGDSRDVDSMMKAIKIVKDLMDTPPFKQNHASIFHLKFPDCPSVEKDEDAYWRCYVRYMTQAVFHSAGTCALGRVLDAEMRVRGVSGLRVADLSAMPYVPRGNTEAVAIAMGERVVDFLLKSNSTCSSQSSLSYYHSILALNDFECF